MYCMCTVATWIHFHIAGARMWHSSQFHIELEAPYRGMNHEKKCLHYKIIINNNNNPGIKELSLYRSRLDVSSMDFKI